MLQKKQTSIQVIQITYRNSADSFYVWESVSGITVRKIFIPNFFILVFPALIMYPRTSLNFQSETSGAMGTSEFLRQGAWAVTWWTRQDPLQHLTRSRALGQPQPEGISWGQTEVQPGCGPEDGPKWMWTRVRQGRAVGSQSTALLKSS